MEEIKQNIFKEFYKKTILRSDWKLLVFLLLLLNVKLIVKILALLLIFLMNRNFKFSYNKLQHSGLPMFYLLIIIIGIVNLFVEQKIFNINYDIIFFIGTGFWLLCILACHQLKLFSEILTREVNSNTLILFFIINSILSLLNFLGIVIESGSLNPYLYQGEYQKYFMGTGDFIKGISFDTSTTNALINAFGVFYFLRQNKFFLVVLCMCVLLMTGSNLTNFLTLSALLLAFFLQSTRIQKSIISICILLFVLFVVKISPQNNEYAAGILKKFRQPAKEKIFAEYIITKPTIEEQNRKLAQNNLDLKYAVLKEKGLLASIAANPPSARPYIPFPNINSPKYQNRNDTSQLRKHFIEYTSEHHYDSIFSQVKDSWQKQIGKIISMQQTFIFLKEHPGKIMTGNGTGCFSSKLAFRATALDVAGNYPEKLSYVNGCFAKNHLAIFLYFFTKQKELHSVTNTPDSVYNQLFGEYGMAGILAFSFFYIGFFLKRCSVSRVLPFLLVMMGAFAFGYWFEQLSVVPFFELMMFLNVKKRS